MGHVTKCQVLRRTAFGSRARIHTLEPVPILQLHVPTRIPFGLRIRKLTTTAIRAFPVQRGQYGAGDAQWYVSDIQECVGERGRGQLVVLREWTLVYVEAQFSGVDDDDVGDVGARVVHR